MLSPLDGRLRVAGINTGLCTFAFSCKMRSRESGRCVFLRLFLHKHIATFCTRVTFAICGVIASTTTSTCLPCFEFDVGCVCVARPSCDQNLTYHRPCSKPHVYIYIHMHIHMTEHKHTPASCFRVPTNRRMSKHRRASEYYICLRRLPYFQYAHYGSLNLDLPPVATRTDRNYNPHTHPHCT